MDKRPAPSHLLRALCALLAALASSSAWARPSAVVGEVEDARGRAAAQRQRAALIRALLRANEIDVVPLPRVASLAQEAGVSAVELRQSSALLRFGAQAGADAAVASAVRRVGREFHLRVAILDRGGGDILSKEVALPRGDLNDALASCLAASIGAALAVHASAEPAPPPPRAEEESRASAALAPAGLEAAPAPEAPPLAASSELAVPAMEVARRVAPVKPDGAGPTPRPAFAAIDVSYTATWRTYRVCPEVRSCDQTPPLSAGASSRYSTDTPYGGILVRADLFPFSGTGGFARGIGLGGGFGQSLSLLTHYTDSQGADQHFGSYQRRAFGELGYRLTFDLGGAFEGWIQVRAGYLFHLFEVDPNSRNVFESRRSGFYGELAALFPLHRYAALDARFALAPSAGPGAQERAAYGANAAGGGFNGAAGLSSDFGHPEWHVRVHALFELVYFSDQYADSSGTSSIPTFARAQETYAGAVIGLKGAL